MVRLKNRSIVQEFKFFEFIDESFPIIFESIAKRSIFQVQNSQIFKLSNGLKDFFRCLELILRKIELIEIRKDNETLNIFRFSKKVFR